jgi:hypothetical protein
VPDPLQPSRAQPRVHGFGRCEAGGADERRSGRARMADRCQIHCSLPEVSPIICHPHYKTLVCNMVIRRRCIPIMASLLCCRCVRTTGACMVGVS